MEPTGASVLIYLGLGANLGDREATFRGAIEALRAEGIVPLRRSPLYESEYVGPWGPQPPYLNAVLEARTEHPPLELLRRTHRVELAFGRRPETHLRPRTIDIDILLYADWTIRHPALVVPHPRLAERRFMLEPLRDLGVLEHRPDLAAHLAALGAEPAPRRVIGADGNESHEPIEL